MATDRSAAARAASSPGQHGQAPAGAEFFRRRLQRAAAIPPEQRDPAVHAFVTSVQLMHAADELLPLAPDDEPELPAETLAGQQAEVQALLLGATAFHLAPSRVEWEGQSQHRLGHYAWRRLNVTDGLVEAAYLPALQPLGGPLLVLVGSSLTTDWAPSLPVRQWALAQAQSARAAISRQLHQAQHTSRHQLLTAEQLEAALCASVSGQCSSTLLERARRQVHPTSDSLSVRAAMLACCDRWLELEPDSPKALTTASSHIGSAATTNAANPSQRGADPQLMQHAMHLLVRAFNTARATHNQYWTVEAGSVALAWAVLPGTAISRADLSALLAAAEEAPATVKRLRGLLPHSWIASLERSAAGARAVLPAARLRLRGALNPGVLPQAAVDAANTIQEQDARLKERCSCSGCGKEALGLRRCARCKQAAYCSRDCQVRHWPQHKRECKALSSSGGS